MAEEKRNVSAIIETHIALLGRKESGWTKELNLVSWNGNDAKYDLRDWSSDHKRMSRGITLYEDEIDKLVKGYSQYKTQLNARNSSEAINVTVEVRDQSLLHVSEDGEILEQNHDNEEEIDALAGAEESDRREESDSEETPF